MTSRALVGGLALGVGTTLCIFPAIAADLTPPIAPLAPVANAPPSFNWTGFYVGGHSGAAFPNSSWIDSFTGASNTFNSYAGPLLGAQIGANAQFNAFVFGFEGDFSWTGLKGSDIDSIGDTINTNVDWTSTVTGRIGVAFNCLLLYGKGGLALAQDKSSLTDLGGNTASNFFTRAGWTAGGGFEYAFDRNWSARIEYDYLGFNSQTLNFTTPLLGTVTSSASLNVQEIKAGLDFRIGF